MSIADEINLFLRRVLPDWRERAFIEPDERQNVGAAVQRWRAEAKGLTRRQILDPVTLRSELRSLETHLARSSASIQIVRTGLECAREAAGPPDTWAAELVDRFFEER
jgi:hypothetical protein